MELFPIKKFCASNVKIIDKLSSCLMFNCLNNSLYNFNCSNLLRFKSFGGDILLLFFSNLKSKMKLDFDSLNKINPLNILLLYFRFIIYLNFFIYFSLLFSFKSFGIISNENIDIV